MPTLTGALRIGGGYSPDALSYWQYRDAGQSSVNQMQEPDASGNRAEKASELSTAGNVMSSGDFKDDQGLEALARMYPREQFHQRKKQYRELVQTFNQIVHELYGVPSNNLVTGMTVVLAGAYAAYHNKSFPDDWVKQLYLQMEQELQQDPRLATRTVAQRASDYLVMVGSGMALLLMQAELQKAPNPKVAAQLRRTGADALRSLVSAEPDRVEFSSSGLRLR